MKNKNIDFLRAFAIILVVFGHSIIIYDNSWNVYYTSQESNVLSNIKIIINLIQMPLFLAISGYLFFYTNKIKNYGDFIIKKIKRLIIPFIIIALFWMLPIRYGVNYNNYNNHSFIYNVIVNIFLGMDNGHLWYLPTLFFIFLISYFYIKLNKYKTFSKKIDFLILLLLFILAFIGNKFPSYIGNLLEYSIYFFEGIVIHKYFKTLNNNKKLCCFMFLIILLISYFILSNIYLIKICKILIGLLFVLLIMNIDFSKVYNNKIVELISSNSFGIYLFHSPLVYISFAFYPNILPIYMIFINFIIFGFISLCLTYILRKTRFKIFLGE